MLDYQVLYEGTTTTSELLIRSDKDQQNVSWQIDTGNGITASNMTVMMNESQNVIVIVQNDYSINYVYNTNATANSSQYRDEKHGTAIVS